MDSKKRIRNNLKSLFQKQLGVMLTPKKNNSSSSKVNNIKSHVIGAIEGGSKSSIHFYFFENNVKILS